MTYPRTDITTEGRPSVVRSLARPEQAFLVFVGDMLRLGRPYRTNREVGLRLGRCRLSAATNGTVLWGIEDGAFGLRVYPGDRLGQHFLAETLRAAAR